MKKLLCTLVLCLVFVIIGSVNAFALIITLYPTQDAEIARSNNTAGVALNSTNFGASPYLTINGGTPYGPAQTTSGTYPRSTDSYGLFQFDLAFLPAGSTIDNAMLTLYSLQSSDDASSPSMLYPVTSSWTEMGVTYNTKPTQSVTGIARLAKSFTNPQAHTYDVTDIAQDWFDGTVINYGLITNDVHRGVSSGRYYTRIYSRESVVGGDTATDPRLDITYTAAPVTATPEPGSMVLLGIGLFGVLTGRLKRKFT